MVGITFWELLTFGDTSQKLKVNFYKTIDKSKHIFYNYKNETKDVDIMEKELQKVENHNVIEHLDTDVDIKSIIYTIRGKQVILDSDIARLYHCETKYINRVVKRNIERFPQEYCFQLNEAEYNSLRCQIVTLKKNGRGEHRKYMPFVFTEHGTTMLAGLLTSDIAISVSIKIVNSFIEMRRFLNNNGHIFQEISNIKGKLLEHDKKFDEIFNELQHEENIKQKIFFEGQIWDSYSLIVDIIKKAKKKILIIDNYIDDSILKMLSKKNENVEVVILTSNKSNIQNLDIQKFNKEYPTLKVAKTNKFHDRFIIIDNKELYHCGASIKDLGNKCFGINRIEDEEIINKFIEM